MSNTVGSAALSSGVPAGAKADRVLLIGLRGFELVRDATPRSQLIQTRSPSTLPSRSPHRRCGELDGGVEGERVWMACDCGARHRGIGPARPAEPIHEENGVAPAGP